MRHDDTTFSTRPSPPSGTRRPVNANAHAWAWPTALAVLVAATSLALAVFASVWLVVPYLALMALVLGTPGVGRREPKLSPTPPIARARPAGIDAGAEPPGREAEAEPESTPPVESGASTDAPPDPVEALAPNSEPTVVKTRRGKGRGRKSKPVAPAVFEPTGATWVRVGPGKFVRADSATPSTPEVVDREEPGPPTETPGPRSDEASRPGSDTSPDVSPNPVEEPQVPGAPEPEAQETVEAWAKPWAIDPDPAAEPSGAGEAEENGPGHVAASDPGQGVPAGDAPDATGVGSTEDNGNAPDASVEPDPGVPAVDPGPSPLEFEATPPVEPGPDPEADSVALRPDPPVVVTDRPDPEPSPAADPAPEAVGIGAGPRREPSASRPGPPARPVFRPLVAALRGLAVRRGMRGAGATRPAFPPRWDRRGGLSARVSGTRRHPYRLRNPARSPHPDRTHPPRSPPCGSGR